MQLIFSIADFKLKFAQYSPSPLPLPHRESSFFSAEFAVASPFSPEKLLKLVRAGSFVAWICASDTNKSDNENYIVLIIFCVTTNLSNSEPKENFASLKRRKAYGRGKFFSSEAGWVAKQRRLRETGVGGEIKVRRNR